MPWRGAEYPGEFPSLGWQVGEWIEAWCVIPDGDHVGEPYLLTDEMWNFLVWHYRLRLNATQEEWQSAWPYRRSQLVRPQKWGKGPFSAAMICAEAVAPARFAGWDAAGEPVGREWPTPWIQVTATSEDQTDNVYRALRPMIDEGPLANVIQDTGETRINIPGGGLIEPVTSSGRARLGQRITFAVQDEAMALDTVLPTPVGWTTMGDVAPGDWLLDAEGAPTRVTKATALQLNRDCYEVAFVDGTTVVTSDGHLWLTKVTSSAAKPRVRTTGELYADPRKFRVPAPKSYVLPAADLPVHPYLLGLWLGDGSTGQSYITAGDTDIVALREILADCGVPTGKRSSSNRAEQISISSPAGYQASRRPAIAKALQALPCYRSKHIPAEYLRGSAEQRTALLQGLMDSDGHVTAHGHCTFVGNRRLANDTAALLRTLGQVVRPVFRADPRSREGGCWKVNFIPRGSLQPFRLPRKAELVRQSTGRGPGWVSIASITPVPSVPVRCVEVDNAQHLFLAGEGGHVTHNTHCWLEPNGGWKLADNQRRNLSGTGGRAVETTNAWDPSEQSVAQRTSEASARDVYRDHTIPPRPSLANKAERRRTLRIAYGDSMGPGRWVNLDRIDGEAVEIAERDPGQALRFYWNLPDAGASSWIDGEKWDARKVAAPREIPDGTAVVLALDGSDVDDWTGFRAETEDGYQFTPTYGPDRTPAIWNPADHSGQVPRLEVRAAAADIIARLQVIRFYIDPPYWESEIDEWAAEHGEHRVIRWETYRAVQMHAAAERLLTDIGKADAVFTHDGCRTTALHMRNARKSSRPGKRYVLKKASPTQKIDMAVTSIIAHEAAMDVTAAKLWAPQRKKLTRIVGRIKGY